MRTKIMALIAAFAIAMFMLVGPAGATGNTDEPKDCTNPTITVVDEEAYDEVIEATPDLWWNWSPNDTKGPQDYEPTFPVDERGTWQGPHANGGPMQDTYGTFNVSNGESGNSSWFHREQGVAEHVVHHDAVTHEEPNPDYPCVVTEVEKRYKTVPLSCTRLTTILLFESTRTITDGVAGPWSDYVLIRAIENQPNPDYPECRPDNPNHPDEPDEPNQPTEPNEPNQPARHGDVPVPVAVDAGL